MNWFYAPGYKFHPKFVVSSVEDAGAIFIDMMKERKKWKCPICGLETLGMGIYSHQKKHERERPPEKPFEPIEIFINESIRVQTKIDNGMEIITTAFNIVENQFYTHQAGIIDKTGNVKIEFCPRYIREVIERELSLHLTSIMENYYNWV